MARKENKTENRTLVFDQSGVEEFSKRFKALRKKAGYTQEQLAFESGISRVQIARMETAKINPTISVVFVIARTMGIDPDEFFKFKLQ